MQKLELFDYQQEGVDFIHKKRKALIAYEPGLGKTAVALSWLNKTKQYPAVIVVPAFLTINWERETKMWMDKGTKVYIAAGKKLTLEKRDEASHADVIIISYAVVYDWRMFLQGLIPSAVVLDEAHYISNLKSKRTKSIHILSRDTHNRIALTGTPINSKVIDLYGVTRFVDGNLFPTWWGFANRYCDMHRTKWGFDTSGASNLGELNQILTDTIMLRKKKKDVLKDLPAKQQFIVPLEITNRMKYGKAEQGFRDWAKGHDANDQMNGLSKIESMKQAVWDGKKKAVFKWIETFLEDSEEKLIVFGYHKKVMNDLNDKFGKDAVLVTGDVSAKLKQERVDAFQTDKNVRLFLGNYNAAGVGITLTASSTVAFVELPWTPSELEQAADRAHRVGQKDNVQVFLLLADNTIDKVIYNDVLVPKDKAIKEVIDGVNVKRKQTSSLQAVINSYRKGK